MQCIRVYPRSRNVYSCGGLMTTIRAGVVDSIPCGKHHRFYVCYRVPMQQFPTIKKLPAFPINFKKYCVDDVDK